VRGRAWTIAAFVGGGVACGEIREVPIAADTTAAASTGGTSSDATTTGSSTGPIDVDTEAHEEPASTSSTTDVQPGVRTTFCNPGFRVGPELAPEAVQIVVDDASTIADLDVAIRGWHGMLEALEITLVRDDDTIVLLEPASTGCGPELDVMFDDDGAPARAGTCGVLDERGIRRIAPSQPLGGFTGTPVAGTWELRVAPTDLGAGDISGWCLSVLID